MAGMDDRVDEPGFGADDLRLLERLGAIADVVDPVPEEVLALGRAVFAFRDPDAQLLALVPDGPDLAAVRGSATTSRLHFFEFGELSVDVEMTTRGPFMRVLGVVADPGGTVSRSVTLESGAASFTAEIDAGGRFGFEQVPTGLIRLTLDRPDAPRLTTKWFDAG